MKTFFAFITLVILFLHTAFAQILNVESQRISQDSTGWAGKADLSFNLTSNQDQVFDLNTSLHLQYKSGKNTYLLLGGAGMIRAGEDDFDNSGHAHFRYNRSIRPWLTLEAFVQGQYNRVLMIDHRELVGAGPRFTLLEKPMISLHTAALYMFEHEVLLEDNRNYYKHRLSSYLAYNQKINSYISFNNIVYFQPVVADFSDHRVMLQSSLKFKLTKIIGFSVNFNLLNNSNPPPGVKHTVYSIRNGLEVRL
jgi:putative salt-induced outer membrane protein YdiY